MEFRQYQYILKVAELGNVTKAANELYITQPSLSHYIAKVEEEVGLPLFNRNTTPITLTPAGERYVETARMILALDDRLRQDISDLANQKKGVITVSMSHARASFFLPYVLPEFREKYPGIHVRTIEVRSDLVEEYVAKGQCDIGFLPFPLMKPSDLEQEVICREELFFVSGKPIENAICGTERIYVNLKTCEDYPYILLKKGHGIRTAIEVLFLEHGIHPKDIFETTSNETAYRLATADMGVAIVPKTTTILSNALAKPYLYSLSEDGVWWEIGAIYRQREFLTAAQRDLIDMMKKRFVEQPI